MSQPKVILLRFDASWLFKGSSQLEIPLVGKLVLDAYISFLKAQKLRNVFYTVSWHTINMLFPGQGQSPTFISQQTGSSKANSVEYCHDRLVDTLHMLAIAMKDLRVLDSDSLAQIDEFFKHRQNVSSYFVQVVPRPKLLSAQTPSHTGTSTPYLAKKA